MRTVFKYKLRAVDDMVVLMPKGADILCVQAQHDDVCIWAVVDDKATAVGRNISIRGTGHPLTAREGKYIGTFQLKGGALVFHVFDGGEVRTPDITQGPGAGAYAMVGGNGYGGGLRG